MSLTTALNMTSTPVFYSRVGQGGAVPFSVADLFTSSEQGAWYDPSDLSTLSQDSANTTPVTTAGQPVGLMLDKSKGLVLGPELITNGNFETNLDGWDVIAPCTMARVESMLEVSRNSGGFSDQPVIEIDLVEGHSYIISADIVSIEGTSSTNVILNVRGADRVTSRSEPAGLIRPTVGPIRGLYRATVTETAYLLAGVSGTTFGTMRIDNISVRELLGNHAMQATAARRLTYQTGPARATLDKIDDRFLVTVPTGGFTGTMVLATDQGTASYGVTIPAGAYDIGGRGGLYFPGNAIVGQLIRDGALSEGEAAATEAYFVENGATASYGAVTNFSSFWRDCTSLTSFPLIDTSSGTDFNTSWFGCSSLTSFPANIFDNVKGGDFTDAFTSTALTQTSIDNILVSLVTSGIATGTRVFDQSGGSAPSAAGEAAIDTLRSRGWTVTVTGGY